MLRGVVTLVYNAPFLYARDTPEWLQQNFWYEYGLPKDVDPNTIGTVFGFLLVFVQSTAYGNFIEGRKQLGGMCNFARELAQTIYASPLKDKQPDTIEKVRPMGFARRLVRSNSRAFTSSLATSLTPTNETRIRLRLSV